MFAHSNSGAAPLANGGSSSGGPPALGHHSDLLLSHSGDDQSVENGTPLLLVASGVGGGGDKAELTCISEEGIADMDLADNMLYDLDFDCITSCNKVRELEIWVVFKLL